MENQKGISSILIILIIVGVLLVGGGVWYYLVKTTYKCTMEAKVCPNGTTVGRTGPNCEFAACPGVKDETADWKTYRNEKYGFEVKYPYTDEIAEGEGIELVKIGLPFQEAYINLIVEVKPSVSLPGTYGGRYYFTDYPNAPVLNDRALIKEVVLSGINFTEEYWVSYGGMGSWDTVINAYTKHDGNYYLFDLHHTFISGVPGDTASGEELVKKALAAMEDESNKYVHAFSQILSTFKFISQ